MEERIKRQLELEEMASGLGVDRYNRSRPLPWRSESGQAKEECELAPGKRLLNRAVPRFAEAIARWIDEAGRKAGRKHTAAKYLVEFEPEVAAFIASRSIINALMRETKMASLAVSIGTLLEDHIRFLQMEESAPGLMKSTLRLVKTKHARHRQAAMRRALREASVVGLQWTEEDKLLIGSKLIELFADEFNVIELVEKRTKGKTHKFVAATPEAREKLTKEHENEALLSPVYLPMVVEPEDWTTPLDGGYLNKALSRRVTLMRVSKKDTIDDLFSTDMPEVYDAINTLQQTAWRINRSVYDVAREAWAGGDRIGGLPPQHDDPIPARPAGIPEGVSIDSLPVGQQQQLKAWRAEAREAHEANAKLFSKRLSVMQQLWIAGQFAAEEAIYFPYTMDFRGRIYAVPTGVQPQGDDLAKGLLEFSAGKPLGEDGAYWLAVHIANTFGDADKLALDERVAWTLEHEEEILDSAFNPLDGRRFWTTADKGTKAWQALAACFEWAGYKLAGDEHVSHVPIGMDGSCSGLQHFSAMLKDEVGGAAVNLIPSETCNDIYMSVAHRVETVLSAMDGPEAEAWRGKVVRDVVKQPCMTFAYSVTKAGVRDQIKSKIAKLGKDGQYLESMSNFEGAAFLGPVVYECIREQVVAAAGAMDWLQEAAKLLTEADIPCIWSTPVGLPVVQENTEYKGRLVKVWFQGQRVRLTLAKDTKKLNKSKQASSIAPNFVHSLDAAHLMKTVNACYAEGIDSFAVIHDSFGTHAADVSVLNHVLRREFVEMYSEDVLEKFRDQIAALLPDELADKLPPLPGKGTLRLESVMESDFFFA